MGMKNLLAFNLNTKFIALCLSLCLTLQLSAKELYVGNVELDKTCTGKHSLRKNEPVGAAVKLSGVEMERLAGAEITRIALFNSCVSNAESLKVFVAENLDDTEFLNETEVTPDKIGKGWNVVDLSAPVKLSGDKPLYIGYFISSSWSQIGANDAENVESYVFKPRKDENGEELPAAWVSAPESFAIYAVVEGESLPDDDVAISLVSPADDLMTGDEGSVVLRIKNVGTTAVNSVSVKCELGNGESVSKEFDALDIAYLKTQEIEFSGLKYSEKGFYPLTFSIEKVNGNDDCNGADNSVESTVKVFDEFIERTLLLEFNSTEKCTNCPDGHKVVNEALEKTTAKVVEVSHHIGFYTDKFTLEDDEEYMVFYNDNQSFAPAIMVDRTNWYVKGYGKPVTPGPLFGVGRDNNADVIADIFDREAARPAYATVELDVKLNSRTLEISVSGKGLLDLKQDTRLTVFVTEDNLYTNTQNGWNNSAKGTYYHHFVNRAILTDVWGDPVDLVAGYERKYTYTVPETMNVDNLNVAAFVSAFNKQDFNDCRVYNAAGSQVVEHSLLPNGEDDPNVSCLNVDDEDIVIVSNSKDMTISISENYSAGRIYAVSGEVVKILDGETVIPVSDLNRGIYIVELSTENGAVGRTKIIL